MPLPRPPSARLPTGLGIVAGALVIALVCAIASISKIGLLPPKLERRDFQTAGVVTHVMVDLRRSGITDRRVDSAYFDRMATRADLVAHLMATDAVLADIARRAHVPADQIAADAPITIVVAGPLGEPGSEIRARQLRLAPRPYQLQILSAPESPVVDIYAQAPSLAQAENLADAAIAGTRDYFDAVAARVGPLNPARTGIDPANPIGLVQLGAPRGTLLSSPKGAKVAALTFLLAFSLAYGALRWLVGRRSRSPAPSTAWQPSGGSAPAGAGVAVATAATALPWSVPFPGPAGTLALGRSRVALRPRAIAATGDGDWPRTTRAMPWMLAGFMAMLWLVPFDSIQLNVHMPIDLKLDRLVLPFIVATWALSLAIGGRAAPHLRGSWIHAAVGAFVVVACLSVICNAPALNQSLELDTSLKKVPLLVSYLSLFVITASVVRRAEVAAFMKYTLGLAVVCALGMVWEKHFFHNPFFDWSQKLLPNVFQVATDPSGYDSAGRRFVHGPTQHPLVAASMLSMAVPIAILGLIHAQRASRRILYGAAVCVLLAGVISTQRKTGLVAPVAAVMTLAYFRRRELLRLAPIAVALLIALVVISPHFVTPVIDQFRPQSLTSANTVNDRTSDYDAVRPDVWSHFALGRGYGSYQPLGHRILDSEVLVRLVEMGVLGLAALFLLGASVVACARRTIHSRHPHWAPSALAGATAAVVFLVVAFLFDSLAYPQLPYVFLSFAALVAVVVRSPDDAEPAAAR
jgi:hypothetical protein